MKLAKILAAVFCLGLAFGEVSDAQAGYYSNWGYHSTYGYHYCVYYPATPRYVYYYNPYQKVYWGRFDLEGKEGEQYSELAEKDKKGTLKEIPESAFPKPGPMPKNPDGTEGAIPAPPAPPKETPKN